MKTDKPVPKFSDLPSAREMDRRHQSRFIPIDVYEDLLDRYERILLFAGQMREREHQHQVVGNKDYANLLARYERLLIFAGELQDKNRQQMLLKESNEELEQQVDTLKQRANVADRYIRLLESAAEAVGLLKSQ